MTDATRIDAPGAHHPRTGGQGRQGHRAQPFRPAQGQGGAVHVAEAGAGQPLAEAIGRPVAFADDCIGDQRRRRGGGAEGRRRAAAGKHPLPQGRGKERSGLRQASWRRWATSSSMTPSPPRIAPMPRPKAWRTLPPMPGRSMQAELTHLQKALGNPERPLMAVVGGAKVSTKIELLENLVQRVETLVIGGAMANTFLAAQGHRRRQVARARRTSPPPRADFRKGRSRNCADHPADRRGGGERIQGQCAIARLWPRRRFLPTT